MSKEKEALVPHHCMTYFDGSPVMVPADYETKKATQGIPWRYDFENMPKDQKEFLVWTPLITLDPTGPNLAQWSGYFQRFEIMGVPCIPGEDILAWCPIDPPERQIDREEKK